MSEPAFIQYQGSRILRLDYTGLSGTALVQAFRRAERLISAHPPRSLRTLSLLDASLTADTALAVKQCALRSQPYVAAAAVVGSWGWRVVLAAVHERPDILFFDDEPKALDWLAQQVLSVPDRT